MRLQRALDKCPRCGKGPMVVDNATAASSSAATAGSWSRRRSRRQGRNGGRSRRRRRTTGPGAASPTSIAMHDMGLATVIGGVNKDASGKSLSASMKATVERLRTWDSRSQVHEPMDRNLRQAFSELDRLSDKLSVSDAVVEKAAYIYRKALERGLVQGKVDLRDNRRLTLRRLQGQGDAEDPQGPCCGLQRQEEGHRQVLQAAPQGDGHQDARGRPDQVRLKDSVQGAASPRGRRGGRWRYSRRPRRRGSRPGRTRWGSRPRRSTCRAPSRARTRPRGTSPRLPE